MIPNDAAPRTIQRPFTVDARFTVPEGGAEGVLIAQGGRFGGWTLFVKDGRVHYDYNYLGLSHYRTAAGRLEPGAHAATLEIVLGEPFEISPSLTAMGTTGLGGRAILTVDGGDPVELELPRMIPFNYSLTGEGLCCGHDSETAVSEAYHAPFVFTGEIGQVTVTVSGDAPVNDRMEAERAIHAE